MFTRPSAPLTIGGVLDSAIRLYTGTFRSWIKVSLIGSILGAAVALALSLSFLAISPSPASGPAATAAVLAMFNSPVLWAGYLALLVIYAWVYVAIILALNSPYTGEPATSASAATVALRRLPAALLAMIYMLVFLCVGFALLLIPGLYLAGRWLYALVALATERLGPMAAINRSYALSKGHWWRGVTIVSVATIMIIVLSLVLSLALPFSALLFTGQPLAAAVINQVLSALLNTFTLPMLPAVLVVSFHDVLLRKEGGDLTERVSGLAATR